MTKFRCPDCKQRFEIDIDEYDAGDYVNCPECNLELVVEVRDGMAKLRAARERDLDEQEGYSFDEFYEED